MSELSIVRSAAINYARNKFQMIPWWLWLLQIVLSSFFTMFFFAVMADYVSNPDVTVRFVVIGNVVQSIAATTLYAVSDMPGSEKHTGMLGPLMQTPSNLFLIFLGMSFLNIIAGFISSTLSLCYAQFIFGIDLSGANMLSVAVILVLTVFSLTGFGMMIGSIGLRLRTSSIIANLVSYLGLLLCGVTFPLSYLPGWCQAIADILPLTYGVNAMRSAADGADLMSVSNDLLMMVVLGVMYLMISMLLFNLFERKARALGTYDSF